MKSHTSLVAQQPHLSEWADLFFASTFLDIVACPNWRVCETFSVNS